MTKILPELEYIERTNVYDCKPEYVIIWLHGLGANNTDFIPLVSCLKLDKCVKHVFPNAMKRPISINGGYIMQAWYDIRTMTVIGEHVDYEGILESVQQVDGLISKCIQDGFASNQIFLAGFSQGGVIAYANLLLSQHKLAGIVALSCYLPDIKYLASKGINPVNHNTPVFACHGLYDLVVPFTAGFNAYTILCQFNYPVTWMEYDIGHEICALEVNDIASWLSQKFQTMAMVV